MWHLQGAGEDGWWWRLQKTGLPLPPSPTRAPAPASPGGAGEQRGVGPRRGRQGERGSGGGRAGRRVGEPPPRSSPPRSYSERSLPAADGPVAPPPPLPASRRPGPAVTPGRGSSRPASSHPAPSRPGPAGERRGRRNHAATGGARLAGVLFLFQATGRVALGREGPAAGAGPGGRSLHFLENLDADLVFSGHALGKGRRKRSLGWIPRCFLSPAAALPALPVLAGVPQAALLPHPLPDPR